MNKHSNAIAKRISELEQYRPPLTARENLHTYWDETLKQYANKPLNATKEKADTPMPYVDAYKVTYEGFDDTPIHGWYLRPRFAKAEKLPCVVWFHGYSGNKGYPEDFGRFLLMGISVFTVDVRGQAGETGNHMANTFGMTSGWMTQGILDKDTCYYKAITLDALKALEWAASEPSVDPARICAAGGSQGGGLAMIAAALSDKAAIAVADIPNMCHMDFGILNSTGSLSEAARFVSQFPEQLDTVLETLSYYDNMNLASAIRIPILVSCGLKDTVCMPETVYAAYNRIDSEKEMHVYPFNGHFLNAFHHRKVMEFIARHFGLAQNGR
ncbi:acetylesterase [Paenibacillus nanensis]|uniref:Acetylesterase n=1 Tax=Paenibacillus nanensis TaxID=393251 RepID=A0A3A1ULQ4_9BACL|nr:acetylxylan esterase [Paenibacillus nanensis]RIX47922.1 acetylesterase [Paenibacillus nanensis]